MKWLSAAALGSLLLLGLGGQASGQYVPKANEEIEATWVNEKASPQREVDTARGWKQYLHVSDKVPYAEGTAVITSKWTDSQGNVWYKTLCTTSGRNSGGAFTALTKLSKSATVKESVWQSLEGIADLKNPPYPSRIDPQDYSYAIYYRVAK